MRGVAGLFERSWSGDPRRGPQWTALLGPLAFVYGAASSIARRRAEAERARAPGCYVVAVGDLTVGGAGKSTVARWIAANAAREAGRAAIILRGHGAVRRRPGGSIVPDFEGYPLERRSGRFGDEAIAHRIALPKTIAVAVDPDRLRAARAATSGYGARVLVLDDGWEQSYLAWDELWVAVDPHRPEGNGMLLPAGPLRRPTATLRQATRIVCLMEGSGEEIPETTRAWAARNAPGVPLLRLERALRGLSPPHDRRAAEPLPSAARVALISGIASPERLRRFVRGCGAGVVSETVYPDHGRLARSSLASAIRRARRAGAELILITEKDEPRWPEGFRADLPVRVLRTGIRAPEPVDPLFAPLRAALADPGGMGYAGMLPRDQENS